MEKNKIIFILLFLICANQSIYAQDSFPEKASWKRFQVEVFGGLSFTDPTDLNLRPEYDEQYLLDRKEFYEYYYPSAQQGDPSYEFAKVRSTIPYGIRFRYRFNRIFSLSLGFKHFSKSQASDVSALFYDLGNRPYILDYEYSPYTISTIANVPFLGIHFSFGKGRLINFEFFLSGGPLFAECRYHVGIARFYSRNDSIYRADETSYNIQGNSTGLSLDTGVRINMTIMGGIKVFCEGGYSYQMAKNLHGKGNFTYHIYRDPNTKYVSDELTWEGYWGVKEIQEFAPLPSNEWEKNDPRVRDFTLDLSGMFLQIGISFSFSL
jgi:hypothetical protein